MRDKVNKKYTKALKLAQSKQYDANKVIRLLNEAIDEGSGEAMYALATWYLFGKHVDKDLAKGNQLLSEAVEKCIPEACFYLAISYERGWGVEKNLYQAFFLYVKGALYGEAECFEEVGRCYYFGIGVRQDRKLAEIWYEKGERLGVDSGSESNILYFDKRRKRTE